MISTNMREYEYYLYNDSNAYGQAKLSTEVQGTIKMTIGLTSQHTQPNPLYEGATYTGLTIANVDDKYVIQFNDQKLKVLYVNPFGRYKQVFMSVIA